MKFLITIACLCAQLFAFSVSEGTWKSGVTFLSFLEEQKLPQSIYYNLDDEQQKLTENILSGIRYSILKNSKGEINQVLIPINDELQIHIQKAKKGYTLTTTPISYTTEREAFTIDIQNSPYYDIKKATNNMQLAQEFVSAYKNSINFKRDLRKGDRLVVVYEQKYRLGRRFSSPEILAAMIETRKRMNFLFRHANNRFYDEKAVEIEGFMLSRPVRYSRISDRFTYRRWHPILKRYRAHLGVDFAAKRGTPIKSAASGKVIARYYSRGYGNVIKVRHTDGFTTVYAHMKGFRRGVKKGSYVKQGQVIGYVGSTGMSTGPHLHFELRKYNKPINPMQSIRISTKRLKGKEKKAFMQVAKNYKEEINLHLNAKTKSVPYESFAFYEDYRRQI